MGLDRSGNRFLGVLFDFGLNEDGEFVVAVVVPPLLHSCFGICGVCIEFGLENAGDVVAFVVDEGVGSVLTELLLFFKFFQLFILNFGKLISSMCFNSGVLTITDAYYFA